MIRWFSILLLIPALVVVYPRLCSTYAFGIRESSYPQYFGPDSHNINGVMKHDRERSWLVVDAADMRAALVNAGSGRP